MRFAGTLRAVFALTWTAALVFADYSGLSTSAQENHLRIRMLHEQVQQRDNSKDDLLYCYGETAICSEANNLFNNCTVFENNFDNLKPWYDCICGNGYVSTQEACYWCDAVFNQPDIGTAQDLKDSCSSASASIAPIPSSVLSIESAWNSSYTGTLPPGGTNAKATTTTSSSTHTSSSHVTTATSSSTSASTTTTSSSGSSNETITKTYNGGAVITSTSSQPAGATVTVTQGSTEGSSTASNGLRGNIGTVISALVFGVVVMAVV